MIEKLIPWMLRRTLIWSSSIAHRYMDEHGHFDPTSIELLSTIFDNFVFIWYFIASYLILLIVSHIQIISIIHKSAAAA